MPKMRGALIVTVINIECKNDNTHNASNIIGVNDNAMSHNDVKRA